MTNQSDRVRATCYLRVARGGRGFLFNATTKPSASPLTQGSYNDPLPTRQFKMVLELPVSAFAVVDGTVRVDVPESALQEVVRAEVELPE